MNPIRVNSIYFVIIQKVQICSGFWNLAKHRVLQYPKVYIESTDKSRLSKSVYKDQNFPTVQTIQNAKGKGKSDASVEFQSFWVFVLVASCGRGLQKPRDSKLGLAGKLRS